MERGVLLVCIRIQVQDVAFGKQPYNNHVQRCRDEIRSRSTPRVKTLPTSPVTLESRSPWLLGRCSPQLRKSCAGANVVHSRVECLFILEYYFALKSFAAVPVTFSNAYPDKEVPNKTTMHQLVTTFLCDKCLSSDFKQCIRCNNGVWLQESILSLVSSFCAWMCSSVVVGFRYKWNTLY
jgi:hypothetical protein